MDLTIIVHQTKTPTHPAAHPLTWLVLVQLQREGPQQGFAPRPGQPQEAPRNQVGANVKLLGVLDVAVEVDWQLQDLEREGLRGWAWGG